MLAIQYIILAPQPCCKACLKHDGCRGARLYAPQHHEILKGLGSCLQVFNHNQCLAFHNPSSWSGGLPGLHGSDDTDMQDSENLQLLRPT